MMYAAAATCCAVLLACRLATAQPAMTGSAEPLDFKTPTAFEDDPSGRIWSSPVIPKKGATYLRLHFESIVDLKVAPYDILLVTRTGVTPIPGEDFAASSSYTTGELLTDELQVQVQRRGSHVPDGLSFSISAVAVGRRPAVAYSIPSEGSDLKALSLYRNNPLVMRAARSIARLNIWRVTKYATREPYSCTGFVVAPGILLTNNHCIRDDEDCAGTAVLLPTADGRRGDTYGCAQLLDSGYRLDFAVIRLGASAGGNGASARGPEALEFSKGQISPSDQAMVLGYPGGEDVLQVSIGRCRIDQIDIEGRLLGDRVDFAHSCSTGEGSSGSPVLDTAGRVVGLHHLGFATSGEWQRKNRAVTAARLLPIISELVNLGR